jgi:glycerophosphoryl diester phosphodiesterase
MSRKGSTGFAKKDMLEQRRRRQSVPALLLCGMFALAAARAQNTSTMVFPTLSGAPPLVIGHRGAAGHRPEHTLASYELAIDYGVDFIEPDLVSTRDGVLIARHENDISETSNVAEKFPERRTTKTVDGKKIEGYFTEDFTLAEIKTLRARERLPFRNQGWNNVYEIPTFQEVIDLARRRSEANGRVIGIYPETKHPSYFRSIGLALEPRLLEALEANGYRDADAPVFIQSFEVQNLMDLSKLTKVRLIQLMEDDKLQPYDFALSGDRRTYGELMTPKALAGIAAYAFGIGPYKRSIVPQGSDGALLAPTTLVADAHKAGLAVHPYTFRDEPVFLASDYRLDPVQEYMQFYRLGVDGVFSDFGDTAVRARNMLAR